MILATCDISYVPRGSAFGLLIKSPCLPAARSHLAQLLPVGSLWTWYAGMRIQGRSCRNRDRVVFRNCLWTESNWRMGSAFVMRVFCPSPRILVRLRGWRWLRGLWNHLLGDWRHPRLWWSPLVQESLGSAHVLHVRKTEPVLSRDMPGILRLPAFLPVVRKSLLTLPPNGMWNLPSWTRWNPCLWNTPQLLSL